MITLIYFKSKKTVSKEKGVGGNSIYHKENCNTLEQMGPLKKDCDIN